MADPTYIDSETGVLTDGEAWVGIAHESLSLPAATVTWESTDDSQTGDFSQYMDLVIIAYARSTTAAGDVQLNMKLNDDAGGSYPNFNYADQRIRGYGSGANSSGGAVVTRLQVGDIPAASATANQFGVVVTTLFDINSGKYKSGLSQSAADRNGAGSVALWTFSWMSQAPITKIVLADVTGSGDFVAGSMFSLFGILPRMVA